MIHSFPIIPPPLPLFFLLYQKYGHPASEHMQPQTNCERARRGEKNMDSGIQMDSF